MKTYLTLFVAMAALTATAGEPPPTPQISKSSYQHSSTLLQHFTRSPRPSPLLAHFAGGKTSLPENLPAASVEPQPLIKSLATLPDPGPAPISVPSEKPAMIGAWLEPVSGKVITGCYVAARQQAIEERRPLVVLSRLLDDQIGKAATEAPDNAVLTIVEDSKDFPLAGVYAYKPRPEPGSVGLIQWSAPVPPAAASPTKPAEKTAPPATPPSKLRASKASLTMAMTTSPDIQASRGCPGGSCKPRIRLRR